MNTEENELSGDLLNLSYQKAEKDLRNALLESTDASEIKEKSKILTAISIKQHRAQHPEDFGDTPADNFTRKR
ncbi:MAG: hypothetical protein NVS1B13_08260 [Flavisolibacter sp.]